MRNDRRSWIGTHDTPRTVYVDQLQAFYAYNRLRVHDFDCQHAQACAEAAGCELNRGSEAHVGARYGEALRVVVVSLDTGGKGEPMDGRRETIEKLYRLDGNTLHMNPHMRGTTKLLKVIYGIESDTDGGNLFELYAMTNAAKCSRGDPNSSAKVPRDLYQNCSDYVAPELTCLAPELIVTQGKEAREALDAGQGLSDAHQKILDDWVKGLSAAEDVRAWLQSLATEYLMTVYVADKDVPTLKTIHPSVPTGEWQRFVRTGLRPVVAMAKHLVPDRSTPL